MSLDALKWYEYLTESDRAELWPLCNHETTELRKRVVINGAVQYRRQCLVCGEAAGQAVARNVALQGGTAINDFDESAAKKYASALDGLRIERGKANRARWFEKYNEYLNSPEWARKRERVLRRAAGVCEGCGENAPTQVHHLTYEHRGAEFLFELVALCYPCHDRLHINEEGPP